MAPYKDPDRQREAVRLGVQRHRLVKKAMARQIGDWDTKAEHATGQHAAEIALDWIGSKLLVPTGPLRGQPATPADYMREWLLGAMADGVSEAGMSIARKNAKTGFIANLVLAYLVGPLGRPEWRAVVTSDTGKLALELMTAMRKTAAASHLSGLDIRRSPQPGIAYGRKRSQCDFLAADKATGHAIGADLALLDEAGLLEESQRILWDSIENCLSGRDGSLWALSIQGEGPMFDEMRLRADLPHVYWREWVSDEECALDDEEQWHKSNPGLRAGIKSIDYMRTRAKKALLFPANQSTFRAQNLNQRVSPGQERLCSLTDYQACTAKKAKRKGPYYIGLDLGGSRAMSAAVCFWPRTNRVETYAAMPGIPSLRERGAEDGVRETYHLMAEAGDLWPYEGKRLVPVSSFLKSVIKTCGKPPRAIYADGYRKAEVLATLDKARNKLHGVTLELRGSPGSRDKQAAHDLRITQSALTAHQLAIVDSKALAHAISRSTITYSDPGNRPQLGKIRERARIDPVQALVLVIGAQYNPQLRKKSDNGTVKTIARAA